MLAETVPTWNFFHRKSEPELWCAVADQDPLPRFLMSGEWRFGGHLVRDRETPPGFNPGAAVQADDLSGFYLFQQTRAFVLEGRASDV